MAYEIIEHPFRTPDGKIETVRMCKCTTYSDLSSSWKRAEKATVENDKENYVGIFKFSTELREEFERCNALAEDQKFKERLKNDIVRGVLKGVWIPFVSGVLTGMTRAGSGLIMKGSIKSDIQKNIDRGWEFF